MAAISAPIAASSGKFLISPNVGLMIWTLLLFGISMFILAKLAFPRITEALDRRQKAIEATTRQPEMRDEIASLQCLGFALTEACFFYGLVAGLLAAFIV